MTTPTSMVPQTALEHTVQDLPQAQHDGTVRQFFGVIEHGPLLPSWGSRQRLQLLQRYDRHDFSTLWTGASAGLQKKIAATPWEVTGPAGEDIQWAQDLLRNANFGAGWSSLVMQAVRDFLRYDTGAFIEVIGPGDPLLPMAGPAVGLATLDPLRAWPTGDPVYPVAYFAQRGTVHLLHHTRVITLLDAPDSDEQHPGWGLCALSRAIALAVREFYMARYGITQLDDSPPPGFLVASNINKVDMQSALNAMRHGMNQDEPNVLGRTMVLYGGATEMPSKLESVALATPPEKFDWPTYVDVDVNMLALALGVDKQDIWELTSGGLGTATQSEVLARKGRGNTPGFLMAELTRVINDVLPLEYEFQFKFRDSQEDQERAAIRAQNAQTVQTVASALTPDEVRRFLVATDDAWQDILLDPAGNLVRLDDADRRDPNAEAVAADTTGVDEAGPDGVAPATPASRPAQPAQSTAVTTPTSSQQAPAGADVAPENLDSTEGLNGAQITAALEIISGVVDGSLPPETAIELLVAMGISADRAQRMVRSAQAQPQPAAQIADRLTRAAVFKAFATTSAEFMNLFVDLVNGALDDDLGRRRAGTVLRAQLRRLGTEAFRDGLEEGGVNRAELSDADREAILAYTAEQSRYVTGLLNTVYKDGLSSDQVLARAGMWSNKTLRGYYHLGIESAIKNGAVKWHLGSAEEHCRDCLRLNGQVHRFVDWKRRGFLPGAETLECKGYNCQCRFERTAERARGRF